MNEPSALVATVAEHGLPTRGSSTWHAVWQRAPLNDEGWTQLLHACHRQRLIGHLCDMVISGVISATDGQKREVTAWDLQLLAHRARLDRLLVDAVGILGDAGIDHRVLKGAALARTAYPRSELRHYYDIDLLAPTQQFDDAVNALCAAGFNRRSPPPRPGYDGRFAKSVTLRSSDDLELDLHRTLIAGPFGFLFDLRSLWASVAHVDVNGQTLNCFAPEESLLHVCCSAALGDVPPRWSTLRDVAQLLCSGRIDSSRFVDIVDEQQFGLGASIALEMAADRFDLDTGDELIAWAKDYEPGRSERRRLRVYRDRRNFAAQSLASLFVLHGVRARIAYGYAAAVPSREFLRSFDTTRIGWLMRGNRSLRGS
jgi:Uncharacterised nucleotidyltransferase